MKKALVIICTLVIAALSIGAVCGIDLGAFAPKKEPAFVASNQNAVAVYSIDNNGNLKEDGELPRGAKVDKGGSQASSDGVEYTGITYGEKDYFIESDALVETKAECVKEKTAYVRTPVTVYAKKKGPEIAGFARKGSQLEITGFDKIDENGNVNKYRIKYGEGKGYVYAKYLVLSQEEADKYYNENGEYDKAKKDRYSIPLYGGDAEDLDYYPHEKGNIKGKKFCDNARAVYLHAGAVTKDEYFDLVMDSGANAVVINIDGGTLAYESPVAQELCPRAYKDAHMSLEKYQEAVKKYTDAGIYTIGRIACFNDTNYAKDHPEDCIKTGGKTTEWVSAYSRNAWEYKVSMAVEAVKLIGFDEIQFDYVRFPETAYNMSTSGSTDFGNQFDESKAQAIQNFCFYASDQIHEAGAYFSADVFGECSNGYVTAYGQYWPAISNVVDAISSMPYTDHFGTTDTWSNPYSVMHSWASSAAEQQSHIPTPAIARTWITGYNTPYNNPTVNYGYDKLKEQVDALNDAGLTGGFIPWNSSCELSKYKQYQKIWEQ